MKSWVRIAFLLGVLAGTRIAAADGRGTTSADFLKIGLGAAAVGAGEAYAARSGDVQSLFYNPAGLATIDMSMLSATHLNWIADTQYEALAFARPMLDLGTLGTAIYLLHMPGITATDELDNALGQVDAYDLGIQCSFARDLSSWGLPGLSGGASLKFLHRELAGTSASGLAMDLGAQVAVTRELTVGLAATNLGYLSKFAAADESLPVLFRAGAAYTLTLAASHELVGALDLLQPLDNTFKANLGLEYVFAEMLSLRAGYQIGYDNDGLQAGAGVRWENLSLDYAFKWMSIFGPTHFISASVGFGTSLKAMRHHQAQNLLKDAEDLNAQSKYQEALKIVNQVVGLEPDNQTAVQLQEKLRTVIDLLQIPNSTAPAQNKAVQPNPDHPLSPDEREEKSGPAEVKP